jgi:hypothetical protein
VVEEVAMLSLNLRSLILFVTFATGVFPDHQNGLSNYDDPNIN